MKWFLLQCILVLQLFPHIFPIKTLWLVLRQTIPIQVGFYLCEIHTSIWVCVLHYSTYIEFCMGLCFCYASVSCSFSKHLFGLCLSVRLFNSVFKNAFVAACSAPCTVAHVSGSLTHSIAILQFPYHCQLVIKTMWTDSEMDRTVLCVCVQPLDLLKSLQCLSQVQQNS